MNRVVKDFLERKGTENKVSINTTRGIVDIVEIKEHNKDGVYYLDVTVGDSKTGDPHYRIFNPPELIDDPLGDIEIDVRGGEDSLVETKRKMRRDPFMAVVEVIAQHGGIRK